MESTDEEKNRIPRKKNDELLKGIFEDNFPDFLRFIFPDADELFDFDRGITFLDKEMHSLLSDRVREGVTRIADLLVKVYLRDGSERWILINTEIEGGNDVHFSFRIFQYWYRIFDKYNVPVETIAVFTGDRNQKRPNQYNYEGIGTAVDFRYHAYHIFDHEESDLLKMDNIFAYIVLTCQKALLEGKVAEEELAADRSTIARSLIDTGKYDKGRIISFLIFLKSIIFIGSKEKDKEFDSFILKVTKGEIDMGVLERVKRQEREFGLEKGLIKGRAEERARAEAEKRSIVRNLIIKFDNLSDDSIAALAEVPVALVSDVRKEISRL
jgi:hypothetical protein